MNPLTQEPFKSFENLKFDPFDSNEILLNNSNDPDKNFYNEIQSLDTPYFFPEELSSDSKKLEIESNFSVLHINIRSMSKSFEAFKRFLHSVGSLFKVLCITETWCDETSCESSLFHLSNYKSVHQVRSTKHKNGKGGGVCIYIHNSLDLTLRKDLNRNSKNVESISVEIINKNSQNFIISNIYRPPDGDINSFDIYLRDLYSKTYSTSKLLYVTGDLNLNVLDYKNDKVKKMLNTTFEHGLVPVINKPTRVTRNTASAIDHIITNSLLFSKIETGIVKTDISDHFIIFILSETPESHNTP